MNDVGWYAYTPLNPSTDQFSGPAADPSLDGPPQLADARRLMRRAVTSVVRTARVQERPSMRSVLLAHFPAGLDDLAVVEETWPAYEHVNVQAGLDAWLDEPQRRHRLVGISGFAHHDFGLGDFLSGAEGGQPFGPRPGNVSRVNLPSGPDGQVMECVRCALYLVEDDDRRTALLVRGPEPESGMGAVALQIVSDDPDYAREAAAQVRTLALRHNVYRGHLLSFGGDVFGFGSTLLQFHTRPRLSAEQLILPAPVLESVRRQVIGLAEHKHRLLAAGQHLKRGLLLFGPPGVGKTHTVRYLLSELEEVTVIQLTGSSMSLIGDACSIARSLAPSLVVIEDVDLIAEDRGDDPGHHPLLFQLLNEMDGLDDDADVVFVLTTNRADLLEPALAARPGRVDQAVELTLPDTASRQALFDLYSRQVEVDTSHMDDLLARTDGVTASFIKELLRRACVIAAEAHPDDDALRVSADDLDAALTELLDTRNTMTRVLLGAGDV